MKSIIRIIVVMTLVLSSAYAQEFQGEATYKTQRSVDIKLDSTSNPGMTSDMQKQMQAMLKKQFQKTYTLYFNKEASIYKEEESLAPPQVGGSDFQVMVVDAGGSDVLYKNTKNKIYTDQKDTMGKVFLVKDDIEKIDWKLEKETKFIGQYQCFKANYVKMVPKPSTFSGISVNEQIEEKDEEENEPEMIERVVTAWYTLEVPVNNGPAMFQGLPGLILEVHDGKLNIVCSKVIINPESKIEILEPSKGKEVNREDYDKIMEKKRKEMLERYAPRNGRRNGESIEIRIGG